MLLPIISTLLLQLTGSPAPPAQDGGPVVTPAQESETASPPDTPAERPTGGESVALIGATVHTMGPGSTPSVATILIVDGRVTAVGDNPELPAGCVRVDVTGMHVIPSLLDGYVNFDAEHDLLYTLAGVGVVRDLGGEWTRLAKERDPEARARALGPHLLTSGAALDGDPPSSSAAVILRSPEAAEQLLPILFEVGFDFVSRLPGLPLDVLKRVTQLAHERNLKVWGPVGTGATLADTLAAGQDGVHLLNGLRPSGVSWELIHPSGFRPGAQLLLEHDAPLVPLMMATARQLENQSERPDTDALLKLLAPSYSSWWQSEMTSRLAALTPEILTSARGVVTKRESILKLLHEMGVRLIPGSGAAQPWLFPGRSLHQELALWQNAGIPAAEVLRMATRGAAHTFGLEGQYGTIEPGTVASLVVLRSDPTLDIRAIADIERVVVRGRVLNADDLEDMIAEVAAFQDEARAAFNQEVVIAPPELPENSVPILGGVVQTTSAGLLLRTEHFRVAQLDDGKLAYVGNVVYAPHSQQGPREMLVAQITENGKLVEAKVVLRRDDLTLTFEATWVAGSWRMRRSTGPEVLGTTSTTERPFVVDVGSITTALVLGQLEELERFPVLTLLSGLEPELATWALELDNFGQHQVRTHQGRRAFRFNAIGAPELAVAVVGAQTIQSELIESDAFGGPGLRLPAEKRRIIEERSAESPTLPPASSDDG